MYRICIQRINQESEWLIAEDNIELTQILDLASEINYEILIVEKIKIEYARDFLERIIKEISNNKDLVTGKKLLGKSKLDKEKN